MPYPKVDPKNRMIPNLRQFVDFRVEQEIRRLWTSVYGVQDASLDISDQTLTKSTLLDRDLVAGKLLLFILRQDVTGGRTWTWAKNKDAKATTKFKGTGLMTPLTTTANTYTTALFYCPSETEAILIGWLTGGSLG